MNSCENSVPNCHHSNSYFQQIREGGAPVGARQKFMAELEKQEEIARKRRELEALERQLKGLRTNWYFADYYCKPLFSLFLVPNIFWFKIIVTGVYDAWISTQVALMESFKKSADNKVSLININYWNYKCIINRRACHWTNLNRQYKMYYLINKNHWLNY